MSAMNVGFCIFLLIIAVVVIYLYNQSLKKQKQESNNNIEVHEDSKQEVLWNAKRLLQLAEVKRQAELVGDQKTVDEALNGTYNGKLPDELSNGMYTSIFNNLEIINIAGINYRGNLKAYVGDFKGVLVPEPKNDYDPNAIMVKCEDGKHLGYIPEDLTDMVRSIIGQDFQRYRVTGHIFEHEDYYDVDEHDRPRKYYTGYINLVDPQ